MSTKKLTFYGNYSAVHVHGEKGFRSNSKAGFALYTNETLDASQSLSVNAVLLDLKVSNISIGLFPADKTAECQNNRVGSAGLPGSVACKIGNRRARILSNGTEWSNVACDSRPPVFVKITVVKGIVTFFVDGEEIECPHLAGNPLRGSVRVGVSTETGQQRGALVENGGPAGILEAQACFSGSGGGPAGGGAGGLEGLLRAMHRALGGGGGGGDVGGLDGLLRALHHAEGGGGDDDLSDSRAPEAGPLYTDPTALKFEVDKDGPIVALTHTTFRCNAPQDGTVYVPVPIGTAETPAIGVSVRFTGISTGYVGCGFFKKAALDAGDATEYLVGKTQHSIGCLWKNEEVFVFIDNKRVHSGHAFKADELTMHVSFDREKGMIVRIEKGNVNCDEFRDMSLFADDLYFGISMSEEGQLAHILPSGLGVPRFHYSMHSMDVVEDTQMTCKHSVCASLSAHERWYGNGDKCFVMRITNACREPIGIGLVSAKLWMNSRGNLVGGKELGPHSIGLILKDRRIYVHFQDEFIQWKPVGRMPPLPTNVDLIMRVSGGKVSFFYQGIPVNLPVIADLTLPADERFRAAYTMCDKGQTAVIPPNELADTAANRQQRCSLLGDAAHVELTQNSRVATALFADALCFSSEAFAITPCAWDSYPQGCSGCKRTVTSEVPLRGTVWLCSKCGSPDEFALCDACYWNENASKHEHDRNTFIPLFGAGHNEMRFVVEDAKDSYLEVGVAPASYKDGLGAFGKHTTTTVLLGKVSDLVKAAMPAEKIVAACPEPKNGDEICLRVAGADMTVLVNDKAVFQTTLSVEDDPFMKQPLRFGVRMGCADQKMRVELMS